MITRLNHRDLTFILTVEHKVASGIRKKRKEGKSKEVKERTPCFKSTMTQYTQWMEMELLLYVWTYTLLYLLILVLDIMSHDLHEASNWIIYFWAFTSMYVMFTVKPHASYLFVIIILFFFMIVLEILGFHMITTVSNIIYKYAPLYICSATACQCFMHNQCKGTICHPYINIKCVSVCVRVWHTEKSVCVQACVLVIGQ